MVEVKHITKSFEGRVVLNDISAVFETGKTNLIIGRSGSGKTVLIKNILNQRLWLRITSIHFLSMQEI